MMRRKRRGGLEACRRSLAGVAVVGTSPSWGWSASSHDPAALRNLKAPCLSLQIFSHLQWWLYHPLFSQGWGGRSGWHTRQRGVLLLSLPSWQRQATRRQRHCLHFLSRSHWSHLYLPDGSCVVIVFKNIRVFSCASLLGDLGKQQEVQEWVFLFFSEAHLSDLLSI